MNLYKYFSFVLGFPKTIYINFKYFNIKDAIKLPIWISHKVWLLNGKGSIKIDSPIKPGMIKIGFGDVGIFDKHVSRTIFQNAGCILFKGKANFGHGSKINVAPNGYLICGKNFEITAESSIICAKHISIGNDCLLSWQNLVMDTDFHKIKNSQGNIINEDKEILIGNNVWIGCRCTILKGSTIGNNIVIAANSCIHSLVNGNNQIIGGQPVKPLKKDINWNR